MTRKADNAGLTSQAKYRIKAVDVKLLTQMFDTPVHPIELLLYGAEIWGGKCNGKTTDKVGISH